MTQALVRTVDDSEVGALADLATEGFGAAVARVEELHTAIADRSFRAAGAAPPRAVHDAIAGAVYAGVRGAGAVLGGGLARSVRRAGGGPRITDDPRGRLAQGALNGMLGDRLEADGSALAVPMAVRVRGRDVACDSEGLAQAFGAEVVTARPVVFVHGLCESDAAWGIRAARHGGTYASRVVRPAGRTPVVIRYNTGLSIAENGRRLAALLEALVAAWPVDVDAVALVGHSMGGLVIRSAGDVAHAEGMAWVERVDTTISLGTPHRGAPLAQAAHLAAAALDVTPESRPFGAVLRVRSAGIQDLRRGLEGPLIAGARHHAVAATLTVSQDHPVGRLVGDLLVLAPSAHGTEATRMHVGGHDHFDLLNSPALDARLREWLA
jgi:PGAP1-like protein